MSEAGVDGTPAWAYDEDGYCVCCGNGRWKRHMPECELRDALDGVGFVERIPGRLVECEHGQGLHFASDDDTLDLEAGDGDWVRRKPVPAR